MDPYAANARGEGRYPPGIPWKMKNHPEYDLFLFIGQSNMAGRGITGARWPQPAPELLPGAGYEYRAVSDPGHLHPIAEPFGAAENRPGGIDEPGRKTGSMVTAFVNAYYAATGTPVIGVSASVGGSGIAEWQGEEDFLSDAIRRWTDTERFLAEQKIPVRHRYMLWCQGETDGDRGTGPETYKAKFRAMFAQLQSRGVENCFLIPIGQYNGIHGYDYTVIHQAQLELAQEVPGVVLASDGFGAMQARGLMKDSYHYYQQAYNEVGTEAGKMAGNFVNAKQG